MGNKSDIIALRDLVCINKGVRVPQFKGETRLTAVVEARQMFAALAKEFFQFSLKKTGSYQNRGHSTIINQLRNHNNFVVRDKEYREMFFTIREEFKEYMGMGIGTVDPLILVNVEVLKTELKQLRKMLAA